MTPSDSQPRSTPADSAPATVSGISSSMPAKLQSKGSTRRNVQGLLVICLLLLATRLAVAIIEPTMAVAPSPVDWHPVPDLSRAEIEGKSGENAHRTRLPLKSIFTDNAERRPVLFYFIDPANIVSERTERLTMHNPTVTGMINAHFYPVKITLDKPLTEAEYLVYRRYAASGAPVIAVSTADGERIALNLGYINATKLYRLMHDCLKYLGDNTP